MTVHERLSVHNVTFYGAPLSELHEHWQRLAVKQLSVIDSQLFDSALPELAARHGYRVDAVYHLFGAGRVPVAPAEVRAAREALDRVESKSCESITLNCFTASRCQCSWSSDSGAP
ncbi:hypothetical protein ASJ79_04785 [Mycobacterium sp. NAZ190054]|nr:hypothetical protein ASJ79_04785 [Mycobacterium sp. NAZ190054]